MSIQLLDSETINKIAAGEVIERPASIVKELSENAIDAGASSLTIEIRDGGQSLIRVTDNGCGIPREEVREAFLRHATSKIRSAGDLERVRSLGFRGEALSSIAAVCRTEIITKTAAALTGTRYVIEGGEEKSFEEIGAPEGTTLIARDIFFHTPVRRKFLKSPATEAAHIAELAEQLALSHPEVSIRFIMNGQNRFGTSGNGAVRDIIYQLYGREIANSLIELKAGREGFELRGFIGKPEISRGSRAMEHYCVNGRYVKSSVIARAIEDGFGNLMMQHSFPFSVLSLTLDPAGVDVNVHPTKRELRFSDSQAVYLFVKEAVEDGLRKTELIRSVELPGQREKRKSTEENKRSARPAEPFEERRAAMELLQRQGALEPAAHSDRAQQTQSAMRIPEVTEAEARRTVPEETAVQSGTIREPQPEFGLVQRNGQYSFIAPEHRSSVRLVGDVFETYWIAEWNDALYIIDQHAAHEKINYERFLSDYEHQCVSSQSLMPPLIVTLTDREAALLSEHAGLFHSLGYEIDHFGGHEFAVRAVPNILPSVMKDELFKTMIGSLSEEVGAGLPQLIIEKTASMSCKAAVKGNQKLSTGEAEKLLTELFRLKDPYNCPHGRPTVIRLTKGELERRFKRVL